MKKIVRLTESDLTRIVKRVILESQFVKGDDVKLKNSNGVLKVEITSSNPLEGIIIDHYNDIGYPNYRTTNIATGDMVKIQVKDGNNVHVIYPDVYGNKKISATISKV